MNSRRSSPGFSRLRAVPMAGRIIRSCPPPSFAMMRTPSWRRSRRRSGRGPSPADLGRSMAYAAALRVARFGTANVHADWETALHVFTYANAMHQSLKRTEADDNQQDSGIAAARGVLHGAMAVYLARYLNVPPAQLPGEGGDRLDDLPDTIEEIRAALLSTFDRQRQVDAAARLVARHLTLGHPPEALIATLAYALLREDAGFRAMIGCGTASVRAPPASGSPSAT